MTKETAVRLQFGRGLDVLAQRDSFAAWADVDPEARTITVNKAMECDSSGVPSLRHVTKTAAGMRTMDIPQRLAAYMAELPRDNLLVIPSAHGGVLTDSA